MNGMINTGPHTGSCLWPRKIGISVVLYIVIMSLGMSVWYCVNVHVNFYLRGQWTYGLTYCLSLDTWIRPQNNLSLPYFKKKITINGRVIIFGIKGTLTLFHGRIQVSINCGSTILNSNVDLVMLHTKSGHYNWIKLNLACWQIFFTLREHPFFRTDF